MVSGQLQAPYNKIIQMGRGGCKVTSVFSGGHAAMTPYNFIMAL
jgi:hypothetical protein